MRQFYETYKDQAIVSALLRQLPWTHNLMRLTLPTMSIVITSYFLLKYSAGTVEHPGQF
jgi:hypothetical protein